MDRAAVIAEARSWIGTPYHHQAHLKCVGADCAGLPRGVMVALGMAGTELLRASDAMGYGTRPDGKSLMAACERYLVRIEQQDMAPGDLCLLIVDTEPQHLGILSAYRYGGLSIIHAVRGRGVVEHRLMFARGLKFVAAYAFPGVR